MSRLYGLFTLAFLCAILCATSKGQVVRSDKDKEVEALLEQATTHIKNGEIDKAFDDCASALKLDPESSEAYRARAVLYFNRGEEDSAISDLNESIRLKPTNVKALGNRAKVLTSRGEHEKAMTDITEAIRLEPKNASLYVLRIETHKLAGDLEQAMADAEEAIRMEPKNAKAHYFRAGLWMLKSELDKAIEDFDLSIRYDSLSAESYSNRGGCWLMKGETDKAFQDFDQAILIDPKLAKAYAIRGASWHLRQETDKAIEDFDRSLELEKTASGFHGRGQVYLTKKDYLRGAADLMQAHKLDPKRLSVLSNLVSIYATCPDETVRDPKAAIEFATKACELTKWSDAQSVNDLAASYFAANELDDAIKWQSAAVELAATNKMLHDQFYDCLNKYNQAKRDGGKFSTFK